MQNSPYPPNPPGPPGPANPPAPPAPPETPRMPGAVIFVSVIIALHAVATVLGGWLILEENYSKQEHGQELLMPMGMAWLLALFCWGLSALMIVCVVLARRRRPWVRVVLAACLILAGLSSGFSALVSLVAGVPSLAAFVTFIIDVSALWLVLGETGHRWFSVRSTVPTSPRG